MPQCVEVRDQLSGVGFYLPNLVEETSLTLNSRLQACSPKNKFFQLSCLCFPSLCRSIGITDVQYNIWLFILVSGFQLRSPVLHGKHCYPLRYLLGHNNCVFLSPVTLVLAPRVQRYRSQEEKHLRSPESDGLPVSIIYLATADVFVYSRL